MYYYSVFLIGKDKMKKCILGLFAIAFVITPLFSFAQTNNDGSLSATQDCAILMNNLKYQDKDIKKNGDISALQSFLKSKGYLNNVPTGYFGPLTVKAVKDFQKANSISPTGYVAKLTRIKILLTCGIKENPSQFIGELSPQGASITMWGTHILATNKTYNQCMSAVGCDVKYKYGGHSYLVKANDDSVLFALILNQNKKVTIWGKLDYYDIEGGFWGITAQKVYPFEQESGKLIISGVFGPKSLKINETGTWTVSFSGSNERNFSYSADWGDGNVGDGLEKISQIQTDLVQPITFSHSYNEIGVYTITFRALSDNGEKLSKSLTVNIGGANSITIVSPNGGEFFYNGNKRKINWKDEIVSSCSTGIVSCLTSGLNNEYYDIYLVEHNSPNTNFYTGANGSYKIAQKVSGYLYDWKINNISNGLYFMMVCKTGETSSYGCDLSDKPFTIQ